jgi:hypothetical protein
MRRKYTDEQLTIAVQGSTSIRQVLGKLGLVEAGGNYVVVRSRIQMLNLDTSHFAGKAWRRGNTAPVVSAKDLSELLKKGSRVQSYKLKKRLLAESLKVLKCESCGQVEWLNQPIPLELDHINGDVTDNRLVNLRLLCPNCHALTETYRGKKLAKCRDETAPA